MTPSHALKLFSLQIGCKHLRRKLTKQYRAIKAR